MSYLSYPKRSYCWKNNFRKYVKKALKERKLKFAFLVSCNNIYCKYFQTNRSQWFPGSWFPSFLVILLQCLVLLFTISHQEGMFQSDSGPCMLSCHFCLLLSSRMLNFDFTYFFQFCHLNIHSDVKTVFG